MRFMALMDFSSSEFKGTRYVKGLSYTIREKGEAWLKAEGRATLSEMVALWLNAKLFVPSEDIEIFGKSFKKGVTSYCIADSFEPIVEAWVEEGRAEFIDGALITLDVPATESELQGEG